MLAAVRRGPSLGRALRAGAPRVPHSVRATAPLVTTNLQRPSSARLVTIVRSFHWTPSVRQSPAAAPAPESQARITEFNDLATKGLVNPNLVYAVTKGMKLSTMTDVQSLTIPEALNGGDVLAQAKTGTGKTLAFLLPVMQKVIENDPSLARKSFRQRSHARDIRAIIISPTRELAEQIAVEAKKVASQTGIVVQTAVGGTHKAEGLRRIRQYGCHVLVGTPGRLKDILSDQFSGVSAPKLGVFVLDEADRLLDDGFAPEIESIQDYLPDPAKQDRQTLMFSATVPKEVMGMVHRTMKPDYKFIKTVRGDEVPTHMRVRQRAVFIRGLENALPAVLELSKNSMEKSSQDGNARPFKAIVYFNSTAEVQLAYEAFLELLKDPMDRTSGNPFGRRAIFQMHSRLTQNQRTRESDSFRRCRTGILLSSDVTARGMDFPDVTHVIQIGSPRTREAYIHRLGRTARANKEGEGWLFLHDLEYNDVRSKLRDLPIEEDRSLQTADVDLSQPVDGLPDAAAQTIRQIRAAMKLVPYESKYSCYRAQLGSLTGVFDSKRDLVRALNNVAVNSWGLSEPPAISRALAQKLSLLRIPGLNVQEGISDATGRPLATERFSRRRSDPFGGRLGDFDGGENDFFARRGGSQRPARFAAAN
ncbi:hypothetical protein VTN31DRAFT_1418 [Thermomyces dupontii]|uniref:uncharacterized protein n=1 Tax=Talaromyces thermophilus TaxID=28565 RepID=UPI0037445029